MVVTRYTARVIMPKPYYDKLIDQIRAGDGSVSVSNTRFVNYCVEMDYEFKVGEALPRCPIGTDMGE